MIFEKGHIPWNKGLHIRLNPNPPPNKGKHGNYEKSKIMQQEKIINPNKIGNENCIEWKMYRDEKGYGICYINRKLFRVHRAAWTLINGPIPKGMHVLHKCDNPACYNVKHLFLGTHYDNMQDMKRKGRNRLYLGLYIRKKPVEPSLATEK